MPTIPVDTARRMSVMSAAIGLSLRSDIHGKPTHYRFLCVDCYNLEDPKWERDAENAPGFHECMRCTHPTEPILLVSWPRTAEEILSDLSYAMVDAREALALALVGERWHDVAKYAAQLAKLTERHASAEARASAEAFFGKVGT